MSQSVISRLVAAWLAAGHTVTVCPTRYALGALRCDAIKHMAA